MTGWAFCAESEGQHIWKIKQHIPGGEWALFTTLQEYLKINRIVVHHAR